MSGLGKLECNRCRMLKLQDEARSKGMTVSIRKSLYGLKPKQPGVDVYIHPRSVSIPSHHKVAHDLDMGSMTVLQNFLPDSDPDKWITAWFGEVPSQCECRDV